LELSSDPLSFVRVRATHYRETREPLKEASPLVGASPACSKISRGNEGVTGSSKRREQWAISSTTVTRGWRTNGEAEAVFEPHVAIDPPVALAPQQNPV
jgi:hypothetical protein